MTKAEITYFMLQETYVQYSVSSIFLLRGKEAQNVYISLLIFFLEFGTFSKFFCDLVVSVV